MVALLQLLAIVLLPALPLAGCRSASAPPQQQRAVSNVSWAGFLPRHDMVWAWSGTDNRTWPASFGTAAWCGNGLHGVSPLVDHSTGLLRLEVARTDVWSCGYAPRLPIGYLELRAAGAMVSGTMRQSLANGTVTGTLGMYSNRPPFSRCTPGVPVLVLLCC